jgi:predicted dehydrogenase
VRGLLSKIVSERPDGQGGMAPCETWDNAILACEVQTVDQHFPMLLSTKRIAPGETNTWFIKIHGTEFSVEFTTKYPKTLRTLTYRPGRPQGWEVLDLGYTPPYATITGGIFEFGFSDSILQMYAAFCDELVHGRNGMRQPFACVTPEETQIHHRVLTAALKSSRTGQVAAVS